MASFIKYLQYIKTICGIIAWSGSLADAVEALF